MFGDPFGSLPANNRLCLARCTAACTSEALRNNSFPIWAYGGRCFSYSRSLIRTTTSWGFSCPYQVTFANSKWYCQACVRRSLGCSYSGKNGFRSSEATPDRAVRFLSRELLPKGLARRPQTHANTRSAGHPTKAWLTVSGYDMETARESRERIQLKR